jgi:hypothetical protein
MASDVLERNNVNTSGDRVRGGRLHDVACDGSLLMLVPVGEGPEVRVISNWSITVRQVLRAAGSTISATLIGALADRHGIERELGQGGMATLYLAHDEHDRKVAVKVLKGELHRKVP